MLAYFVFSIQPGGLIHVVSKYDIMCDEHVVVKTLMKIGRSKN